MCECVRCAEVCKTQGRKQSIDDLDFEKAAKKNFARIINLRRAVNSVVTENPTRRFSSHRCYMRPKIRVFSLAAIKTITRLLDLRPKEGEA